MKRTIRFAEKISSIETPQTVTADVLIGASAHSACGEHSRTTAKSMRESRTQSTAGIEGM